MNFAYGVIAAVGVLVAISLGLIAASPDDVIEPRMMTVDDKPKPCTKEYRPVCGVDGKTYGNMCTLESAGVNLDYQGECEVLEEPVACTLDWRPMCGVDGETYGNLCMLEAAGVELDYEGECLVADEPVACTLEYLPVCGVDGETYGNLCMLEAAGVELDYEGECVVAESQTESESMEEIMETEPSSMSFGVSIPKGTGVPGCEETNECFIPYEFTVQAGTTVTWSNDDTAAHTVTSGNINAGPTSAFDSGMLMAGDTFEFTFKGAGNFDYFCMIHPWMTGIVHVN